MSIRKNRVASKAIIIDVYDAINFGNFSGSNLHN